MGAEVWSPVDAIDEEAATLDRALPKVDRRLVAQVAQRVNAQLDAYTKSSADPVSEDQQRQLAMSLITTEIETLAMTSARAGQSLMTAEQEQSLRGAVWADMYGMGSVQDLVENNPDAEDIYIRGAHEVWVRFADGHHELRPPVADSNEELVGILRRMATNLGQNERAVTSAQPFLDMRLPDGSRLAAAWGVTPEPHVTIRRHRFTDITLDRLARMGTVSPAMAAFLQAAIKARRSMLVVGPQSAGKTTLLRGLAQCVPQMERWATIETEYELLLHEIPGRWPKLMPFESRQGMGEVGANGRQAGEVALIDIFPYALRHSLDRLCVGELRAAETIPTLMAMSRGLRGSLATFHANSARDTFQALAATMAAYSVNWNRDAAMQQIATAIDIIVFIDREDTADGPVRFVKEILEVGSGLSADAGIPDFVEIFKADSAVEDHDPRGYPTGHHPQESLWARRVGFDLNWLDSGNGGWSVPFPRRLV